MPIPLFLNPFAGRGRARRMRSSLIELLTENNIAHSVVESTAPGDLEQKVRTAVADGARQLLVAGGDGSVHEAVNGMLNSGRTAEVGVIPLGSGNDFAKACSIPVHWEDATLLLIDRLKHKMPARRVDIGRMNDRYFANGAGIGIGAEVTSVARTMHLPIGDFVYLLAALRVVWDGVSTHDVTIRYGDQSVQESVALVNVSNGPWAGGMFHISPSAINDDGALDLLFAKRGSRLRILALLPKLVSGSHIGEPEIHHVRIERCEIAVQEPVLSHLDGEIQESAKRFEIEILPGVLPLL